MKRRIESDSSVKIAQTRENLTAAMTNYVSSNRTLLSSLSLTHYLPVPSDAVTSRPAEKARLNAPLPVDEVGRVATPRAEGHTLEDVAVEPVIPVTEISGDAKRPSCDGRMVSAEVLDANLVASRSLLLLLIPAFLPAALRACEKSSMVRDCGSPLRLCGRATA